MPMAINVTDLVVRDGQGAERKLGDWAGQVLLIVNVASRCGFTRQYAGLQKLQDTYGVNFPVMAKLAMAEAPYTTLIESEPAGPVAWNFEKFLISKDGTVLARFKSGVEPDSAELTGAIEAALVV